jgi:hypothetical protein
MQDYRIIIPIGGQLPHVGGVIKVNDKDFAGRDTLIKVAGINAITWGTMQDKADGNKEKVAGIFVDLYGAPYPEIKLTPDQQKKQPKHFVIFDKDSGDPKACYNHDDAIRQTTPTSCPVCKKQQEEADTTLAVSNSIAEMATTLAAYGISIEGCQSWEDLITRVVETMASRSLPHLPEPPGGYIDPQIMTKKGSTKRKKTTCNRCKGKAECHPSEDIMEYATANGCTAFVPAEKVEGKKPALLCNSCTQAGTCTDQDKATTQETGICTYYEKEGQA